MMRSEPYDEITVNSGEIVSQDSSAKIQVARNSKKNTGSSVVGGSGSVATMGTGNGDVIVAPTAEQLQPGNVIVIQSTGNNQNQQQQQHHQRTTLQGRGTPTIMHQPHGSSAIGPASLSQIVPSPSNLTSVSTYSVNSSQPLSFHHNHQDRSHPQYQYTAESPLPPVVQRSLGDRSNEKRKNAALEIEALIKQLQTTKNVAMIQSIIMVLSKDFCTSMNINYRKGGLVGLAATAIGLMHNSRNFLEVLLPPVMHCFDDPESRVRYYACESLYNIAKVSRNSILRYFKEIFDGLSKLFADVDVDVKNGANLLDRLIKDIVTEAPEFHVEQFLPILQGYIRRTNPYIRQLIVGWITLLDSIPDISMLDYLPDFLDGLFNMLSDSNREIRQAADSALSEFLREVVVSTVVEFGPIVPILVLQCFSKERLNRLTAITWLSELIHHPHSGGENLLPYHADILRAILWCISDDEIEIRLVSERTNNDLLSVAANHYSSSKYSSSSSSTIAASATGEQTGKPHELHDRYFELRQLLETLAGELFSTKELNKNQNVLSTKMAALRWINMLMERRKKDMNEHIEDLLPVLLRTLSDPSDAVVLLTLQVLSRISLLEVHKATPTASSSSTSKNDQNGNYHQSNTDIATNNNDATSTAKANPSNRPKTEYQFQLVLNAILNLFAQDRILLETRGSLIIRKLCVLLNAKSVYIRMAEALVSYESTNTSNSNAAGTVDGGSVSGQQPADSSTLQFISTMVQTLNLILLTASELHDLRFVLASGWQGGGAAGGSSYDGSHYHQHNYNNESSSTQIQSPSDVFRTLYNCWCHNPVSAFSLCLLAQAYDLSFSLVKTFSRMEQVTVGFLMQMDKLVLLLESPVFVHLRLQLLDVGSTYHGPLLKSVYGLLMCLPQGEAFKLLNERLTSVCNLRDNLGGNGNNYNKYEAYSVHEPPFGSGDVDSSNNNPNLFMDEAKPGTMLSKKEIYGRVQKFLKRFDHVMELHQNAKSKTRQLFLQSEQAKIMQVSGGDIGGSGGNSGFFERAGGSTGQGGGAGASGQMNKLGIGISSPARTKSKKNNNMNRFRLKKLNVASSYHQGSKSGSNGGGGGSNTKIAIGNLPQSSKLYTVPKNTTPGSTSGGTVANTITPISPPRSDASSSSQVAPSVITPASITPSVIAAPSQTTINSDGDINSNSEHSRKKVSFDSKSSLDDGGGEI